MTTLHETTTYVFKQIDPAKKYMQFTCYVVTWNQVNSGDCYKGSILQIDGKYYLYAGETNSHLSVQVPSKIIFKERRNVVKEIPA